MRQNIKLFFDKGNIMKKTLFTLAALSTVASAAPFNGYYLGGDLGVDFNKVEVNDESAGYANQSKRWTGSDLSLFGGVNRVYDKVIAGAELGMNLPFSNVTLTRSANGANTDSYKYDRGLGGIVSGRLGYMVNPSVALYAKLGFGLRKDKVTHTALPSNVSRSAKKSVFSVLPGFGVEKAFDKVSVRGEYAYDFGKKISVQDAAAGATNNVGLKQKAHTVRLGVAYNF